MKVLVIISGFGGSIIDRKIAFLKNNLTIIRDTLPDAEINVKVFNWTGSPFNFSALMSFPRTIIEEHVIKGYPAQFLYKFITPEIAKEYDYVIISFDDIEFAQNMNFRTIIYNLVHYKYDVLSPVLNRQSVGGHKIMHQIKRHFCKIRTLNMLECFCLVMSSKVYEKYYSMLDDKSYWGWGLDLAIHSHLGMKVGVIDEYTMMHYIKGESYVPGKPNPSEEWHYNQKRLKCITNEQHACIGIVPFITNIPNIPDLPELSEIHNNNETSMKN